MKIIGSSTIAKNNKVTLVEAVAKKLGIRPGDTLTYLESPSGRIAIKKQSDINVDEEQT